MITWHELVQAGSRVGLLEHLATRLAVARRVPGLGALLSHQHAGLVRNTVGEILATLKDAAFITAIFKAVHNQSRWTCASAVAHSRILEEYVIALRNHADSRHNVAAAKVSRRDVAVGVLEIVRAVADACVAGSMATAVAIAAAGKRPRVAVGASGDAGGVAGRARARREQIANALDGMVGEVCARRKFIAIATTVRHAVDLSPRWVLWGSWRETWRDQRVDGIAIQADSSQ